MPFHSVMVEGNGLCIGGTGEVPPIAGFFTTRVVWAKTKEDAVRLAIELIAQEWRREPYVSQPGAKSLTLGAADARPISFIRGLVERPSGFIFFPPEV